VDLEAIARQPVDEPQDMDGDPTGERLRRDQESEGPCHRRRVFFVAFEP
jgi:hypothetical protein